MSITYKDTGVDIDRANGIVDKLKKVCHTWPWVISGVGGFSAALKLPPGYTNPVILTSCDGVGTKLELARTAAHYRSLGQDLVAMVVNDIVANGGRPLAFMDYYACGHIESHLESLLAGIIAACNKARTPLVDGIRTTYAAYLEEAS